MLLKEDAYSKEYKAKEYKTIDLRPKNITRVTAAYSPIGKAVQIITEHDQITRDLMIDRCRFSN